MSNKNADEDRKEKKIFYSKIYNSFNLKQNIRLIFSSKFSFFNLDNDPDLNVACGLRAIAYLWVALYDWYGRAKVGCGFVKSSDGLIC